MSALRNIFQGLEHSSDKWDPYFDIYERHLQRFMVEGRKVCLGEVGVQKGGSLEMWSKYFGPTAKIVGIDNDPNVFDLVYTQNNISLAIGDQGNPEFWDSFLPGKEFNIFIDDAGHYMEPQILTFEKVFPTMPKGSVYICEDCHTSYMEHNGGGLERPSTFIEYAKGLVDVLHQNWTGEFNTKFGRRKKFAEGISSIHFYDSVVVIEKFPLKEMKRVSPG